MHRDIEKVIFDLEGTIFQKKVHLIGAPSPKSLAMLVSNPYLRYEGATRKSKAGLQFTVTKRPPGLKQFAIPLHTHGAQFGAIPSIVQQIGSDGEIIVHS